MTVKFLRDAGLFSIEEVREAEARARQILAKRDDHHRAVADKLMELEFLDGEELHKALGKTPLDSGEAGD